eukprot:GHVN01055048.1.p1 GENE.GHVN01055048.1~~GHVN01055048.1.p1  ORF type:complete len:116 (-),score=16.25 GHVN01055048.1:205-552(-)
MFDVDNCIRFVSPVVAGLDEKDEPFISAFDFIGADCLAKDFVVSGTCSEALYGVCESFWKPDMVKTEHPIFFTRSPYSPSHRSHRNLRSCSRHFRSVFSRRLTVTRSVVGEPQCM